MKSSGLRFEGFAVASKLMAYFIDLFSPETYEAFRSSSRDVSGFPLRQKPIAERIKVGDIFVVGFRVRPLTLLDPDKSIPIHDEEIWKGLSFTRTLEPGSIAWTGKVRSSLSHLDDDDGRFLANKIKAQAGEDGKTYPLDEDDVRKFATHTVNRSDKVIAVSVPENLPVTEEAEALPEAEVRESIRIQALIASIGVSMGLSIWVPRNDRAAVSKELNADAPQLLDRLPLNYDDTTLRTIEQIDVLWLRGRSIARAFEVEHTTSVYSGILRMADLLALQPNMDIKLHIVAPLARREKVFNEIRRPVFSLLDRGSLADSCTYLSYDSLHEVADQKHLAHLSDRVLDEYAEEAE